MGRTHPDIRQTHHAGDRSRSRRAAGRRPPPGEGDRYSIGSQTREWMVSHADCPPLASVGIAIAGRSEARAGFAFVRRAPVQAQALVCERGSGRVWIDGDWRTCGAGMAYLTPVGVAHAYQALAGEPWEVTWALIDPRLKIASPLSITVPVLTEVDPRPLTEAVRGLYLESNQQAERDVDAQACHHYASLIHLHVQRLGAPWQGDQLLAQLWEEVDGDLAHAWDARNLAEKAGLGAEQLRRRCVKEFGHSPMRHLAILRMRRAASLLATSQERITDIAVLVGYDNQFAFSTAFRRIMGMAPREMRQEG